MKTYSASAFVIYASNKYIIHDKSKLSSIRRNFQSSISHRSSHFPLWCSLATSNFYYFNFPPHFIQMLTILSRARLYIYTKATCVCVCVCKLRSARGKPAEWNRDGRVFSFAAAAAVATGVLYIYIAVSRERDNGMMLRLLRGYQVFSREMH